MAKGWTEERRRAQAKRCRTNRPWEKSTGPKTPAGKARSSMNAFKHGGDTLYKKLCLDMLRHNREFLKAAGEFNTIKLIKVMEKQARMRGRTEKDVKNEVKT